MKKDGPPKLRIPGSEEEDKPRPDYLKKELLRILKKRYVLAILGIIVLVIVVGLVVTPDEQKSLTQNNTSHQNTTTLNNSLNHYEDANISFDYPNGWNISNKTKEPSVVVSIEHDENNSFSVIREDLGKRNFTSRIEEWKSNIRRSGFIYYEGELTVGNLTAYELEANYRPGNKIYSTRGIAIQQNQTAYFLIFVFDKSLLDYKDDMDVVLESFQLKPPLTLKK